MPVEIEEVLNRKQLREFIYLPARLHKNRSQWVPPLYSEEWRYFDLKRNKAFYHSEAVLALAFRNRKAVGRIMGIINFRLNNYRREKTARFGYLECGDDQETAHSLLTYVESWAEGWHMEKCAGPLGFSDQDPEGFQIEGFEHEPSLSSYGNPPYMISLLENEGYRKEVDYVVYKVDVPAELPGFYQRIYKRISRNRDYTMVEFSRRKQVKGYFRPVFRLMNETFRDNYGYAPLEADEMDELGKKYLPVVNPNFVKVIEKKGEAVAFMIGIPNMAPGIRRSKGHLLPWGVFRILRSARKSKQLDLYLGAIKEECRGKGLDVMLGVKMIESAQKAGFEFFDSHHELESNLKVRAEMERLGGEIYKRFRVFKKPL
jgi:hypothetical protein